MYMRKGPGRWIAGASACVSLSLGTFLAKDVLSHDHADSPSVIAEPAADITGLYAWMSNDTDRLNLIMTLPALTAFPATVDYVFHVDSGPTVGAFATSYQIICRFDPGQQIECWSGDDEYILGSALVEEGISTEGDRFRVFAGPRADPTYFNLAGFEATTAAARSALPQLQQDAAGCPALTEEDSEALLRQLRTSPEGGDPVNAFAGRDALSIVVSVERELVARGGPILGVWASTHRRGSN